MMFPVRIEAYNEKGHSKILQEAILGKESGMPGDAMRALELATAIVLDQYNGNCSAYLAELSSMVTGIPPLSAIDLKNVQISLHRSYTH